MLYWITKPFKQKFISTKGFIQSSITGVLYPAEMRYYPNGLTVVVDHYNVTFKVTPIGDGNYSIDNNKSYTFFFPSEK